MRGEQRLLLNAVDWTEYLAIGEALRDRAGLRLTYDHGMLEFKTTSHAHEIYKCWLGRAIQTIAEELNLPLEPGGSTTFQRPDLECALEPDECFWIAHEAQVRGRLDWLPERDPPPDLVVEIEPSRSAVNRMGIYAVLGCPEVWRFDGESLRVVILQPDRTYLPVERSPTFAAIPLAELVPFLIPSEQVEYLSQVRALRVWVRQQLAPKPL